VLDCIVWHYENNGRFSVYRLALTRAADLDAIGSSSGINKGGRFGCNWE
jgi:hypothetical protein